MTAPKPGEERCAFVLVSDEECAKLESSPAHINHEETYLRTGTFCDSESCHAFVPAVPKNASEKGV